MQLKRQEIWTPHSRRTGFPGLGMLGGQAESQLQTETFALYRGFLQPSQLTGQIHSSDISGKISTSQVSPVSRGD